MSAGLRDRLGGPLRASRIATGLELLVVPLMLGLQAAGVLAKPRLPLPVTVSVAIVIGRAYDALDMVSSFRFCTVSPASL